MMGAPTSRAASRAALAVEDEVTFCVRGQVEDRCDLACDLQMADQGLVTTHDGLENIASHEGTIHRSVKIRHK
jgi:hypothetical protein